MLEVIGRELARSTDSASTGQDYPALVVSPAKVGAPRANVHSDPERVRRYQGQGSTAETQELGPILEWM